MSNGDAYFISDNGRIRQKTRKVQSTGHSVTHSASDTYHPSSESHGGARPKNTHYYDNYRNPAFDYRNSYYNSHRNINQNVVPNNIGRNQDISRKPERPRPASESRYNGHPNLRKTAITAHNSTMVITLIHSTIKH